MTGKRRGKRLIFLLLPLLLLLPGALLWFYATPLAHWAAGKYLENFDLELQRFDELELRLDGFDLAGLTLANEGLSLGADGVSADFAWFRIEKVEVAALRLVVGEFEFRGSVSGNVIDGSSQAVLASGEIANLELSAPDLLMEGLPAIRAEVLHRFDDTTGFADFEVPEFRLSGENPLSSFLSPNLPQGDVVAGSIAGTGRIEWTGSSFGGSMLLRLRDLSGFIAETAFIDLDTDVEFELTSDLGLRNAGPLEASLARVDPGLPLEDLHWNYSFDSTDGVLEIRQLQAALLGGTVNLPVLRLDRGQFEPARPPLALNLVLSDVDLAQVAGLANYDDLAVTGRVSGYLPLRIEPDGIRIEDGLIGALQPGGSIRYTPQQPASDPRMQTVNELLSDYRFETLNSYVQLDESGDLRLQTEITGPNPTVNPGQPINLNVNIVDNLPELLRSLRAGREISRVLEDQLNRR